MCAIIEEYLSEGMPNCSNSSQILIGSQFYILTILLLINVGRPIGSPIQIQQAYSHAIM